MELVAKLISILQAPNFRAITLGAGILWLLLSVIGWFCGCIALGRGGAILHLRPRTAAFLPFGQIYFTVRLASRRHKAGGTAFMIWWWLALGALGGTLLIWALVFALKDAPAEAVKLLGGGLAAAGLSLLFYLFLRFREFSALSRFLSLKQRLFAFPFGLLGIPLQRIFLLRNANFTEEMQNEETV